VRLEILGILTLFAAAHSAARDLHQRRHSTTSSLQPSGPPVLRCHGFHPFHHLCGAPGRITVRRRAPLFAQRSTWAAYPRPSLQMTPPMTPGSIPKPQIAQNVFPHPTRRDEHPLGCHSHVRMATEAEHGNGDRFPESALRRTTLVFPYRAEQSPLRTSCVMGGVVRDRFFSCSSRLPHRFESGRERTPVPRTVTTRPEAGDTATF